MKRKREFTWRIHGNYVGPGWSAGKYQNSVKYSSVPAVDEFDATAKRHDFAYGAYKGQPKKLSQADFKFYRENIGKGFKRSVSALAVGLQGVLRYVHSFLQKVFMPPVKRYRRNSSGSRSRSRSVSRGRGKMLSGTPKPKRTQSLPPTPRRMLNYTSPGMLLERRGLVVKRRAAPASSSRSKGFFKKGKRKATFLDKGSLGIAITAEYGQSVSSMGVYTDCFYIGHSTITFANFLYDISNAMVKFISTKLGMEITDMSNIAVPAGHTSHSWTFWGYNSPQDASIILTAFTITAGTSTWNDIRNTFQIALTGRLSTDPYFQLTWCECTHSTGGASHLTGKYNLRRARVNWRVKSSLKIQNRTVNVAGNVDADDVDNVPIYGKYYEGNGNYIKAPSNDLAGRDDIYISPQAGSYQGILQATADSGSQLAEPPRPSQLQNVKRHGKAHLDPGEIKTSVIYHNIKIGLNRLIAAMCYRHAIVNRSQLGNYRVFAFEKMIKTGLETEITQMKYAYELDEKRFISITAPKIGLTNTVLMLSNSPPEPSS